MYPGEVCICIFPSLVIVPVVLKYPFILVEAPELVDFWQENFKVQIEARTGVIRLIQPGMIIMSLVRSDLLT